jgi:hypothetical protein
MIRKARPMEKYEFNAMKRGDIYVTVGCGITTDHKARFGDAFTFPTNKGLANFKDRHIIVTEVHKEDFTFSGHEITSKGNSQFHQLSPGRQETSAILVPMSKTKTFTNPPTAKVFPLFLELDTFGFKDNSFVGIRDQVTLFPNDLCKWEGRVTQSSLRDFDMAKRDYHMKQYDTNWPTSKEHSQKIDTNILEISITETKNTNDMTKGELVGSNAATEMEASEDGKEVSGLSPNTLPLPDHGVISKEEGIDPHPGVSTEEKGVYDSAFFSGGQSKSSTAIREQ